MAYTNDGRFFNVAVWVRTHPIQPTRCRLFVHDLWPVESGGPEAEFGLEDYAIHAVLMPNNGTDVFERNDIVLAEEACFDTIANTLKLYGAFKVGSVQDSKQAFEVIDSVANPLQHWLRVKTLFRLQDLEVT